MAPLPWQQFTERMVGRGHPTLADTNNRALRALLSQSGYDPDATTFSGLMGPVFNVVAFGALPGGTDCTPARNAAVAAAIAAGGGVVYYPAGFWHHTTSSFGLTGNCGIIFQGAGRNVTHIVVAADGVVAFQLSTGATRVQFRDMWIGAFSTFGSSGGIQAISGGTVISELVLQRITLQNLTNPVHLDNVEQSAAHDVRYNQTIAAATSGVAWYMVRCNGFGPIVDLQMQATAGAFGSDAVRVDSDCDTVIFHRFTASNMGDGAATAGIRFRNSVGGGATGPRLCRVTDSYAEHCGGGGFVVEAARDVRLEGCHAAVNGSSGFSISGGESISVVNSFALQNQQHGMGVVGGTGVVLINPTCSDNGALAANTYDGIRIDGGVNGVKVIGAKSGDFIFASNKQRAGIGVISATATHLVDNQVKGNQTAGITDGGTATYRRGNRVTDGAMQGRAVLVNGTATVNTTEVLAGDNVSLTRVVGTSTTRGVLTVGTIVAGTSFVIRAEDLAGALSADDDSTVFWEIVH